MNDEVFLWIGGIVVLIFFGYAALIGSIERVVGWKKVDKEFKNLQIQMAEFETAARETSKQEFEQFLSEREAALIVAEEKFEQFIANQNGQCYFADVKKDNI